MAALVRAPYLTRKGDLYFAPRRGLTGSITYAAWQMLQAAEADNDDYFFRVLPKPTLSPTGGPTEFVTQPSQSSEWEIAAEYPEIPAGYVGQVAGDVLIEPNFPVDDAWFDPQPAENDPCAWVGTAPDATVCIEIRMTPGQVPANLSVYFPMVDGRGVRHMGGSFEVYLEEGFDFGIEGTTGKMGGGLWAGGRPSTGGVLPWNQEGNTIRNVWNVRAGGVTFRPYTYPLNRSQAVIDDWEISGSAFGVTGGEVDNPLTPGQWHRFEYEGYTNTPYQADGFCRFWIDDTFMGEQTGVIWAADAEWLWRGILVAHAWQEEAIPQSQKYWIRNPTVYLPVE